MTLVAVASRRASPGATTVAALLAWLWPTDDDRFLIEADPAGGVLAARWNHIAGLSWEPGVLELAASRTDLDKESLAAHGQSLVAGLHLLAARSLPQQVDAALSNLGAAGATALADLPNTPVIADCGRLAAGSPAIAIAKASAMTLVVFRPQLEEVQAVLLGVSELQADGVNVGLVAVGDRPYHPAEVAERAGVEFCVQLPEDPKSADMFFRNGFAWRGLRRSSLARAAQSVADAVAATCVPVEAAR